MASLVWALVLFAGLACSSINADNLGEEVSVEEFPSLVQVEYRAALFWLQQCAGSVLTSYHILTAAGCVSGENFSVQNRRVRAGSSHRGEEGIVKEVAEVYIHPTYGDLGHEGDLAVVRLDGYLTLSDKIKQVPILGEGIELPAGLQLELAAWGTTTQGGIIADTGLYSLSLYNVDYDRCIGIYYGSEIITENMICAGLRVTNGRDIDLRDVGAPIFYSGTAVGVVSFGVVHGNDSYPVVTTAVGSYTNWIIGVAV